MVHGLWQRISIKWMVLPAASLLLTGCNFEKVSPELYVGSVPGRKRMDELKALGVKSIINVRLNPMPKHQKMALQRGMKYYHIPTGVFEIPKDPEIDRFLALMRDESNTPAYVCCFFGDDRTAVYQAVYRVAQQGWAPEKAYHEEMGKGPPEWWPVFRRYIKTCRMAQSHRLEGNGAGLGDKAVSSGKSER